MLFTWYFLDQKINEVYDHEKISRNQIVLFTALAMIIACLGLLGMITNKLVEKTKEIGIRKVLGAKLHQIATVLLNTTAKQIIIATLIGIPIAYYLTQLYLESIPSESACNGGTLLYHFDIGGDHVFNHRLGAMESSEN